MDCWGAFSVTADWSHHSDILHCLPCIYLLQQQSALRFFSLPFKESIEETTLSSAHFFISIVSKHRLQLWASEFVQEPASFSIFVAMIENRRVSAWWAVNSSPKAQFVVCLKKKKKRQGTVLIWTWQLSLSMNHINYFFKYAMVCFKWALQSKDVTRYWSWLLNRIQWHCLKIPLRHL